MRHIVLAVVLLLLFSCQKKQVEVYKDTSGNQKKIIQCYHEAIKKGITTTDTLYKTTQQLETIAEKEPKEYQAMVAIVFGLQNSNNGLYQLGIKNYEKALILLEASTADSLKATALNGIGNNYKNLGDYPKAFENLYASLTLYEKDDNVVGIGSVQNILGDIYFQMDQLEKAKTHILAGMKVLENQKSHIVYLSAAHSLANFYGMSGDFESALKIDEMGIRVSDSLDSPKMKVSFLDNKANCYLFSNRMDSAYFYFNECLKLDLIIGNKKQIADTYSNLAQFFMMKKKYPEAEQQIFKSIELLKSIDAKPNLGKSYAILSEIYTNQNQYEKAFAIQKEQMANNQMMIEEKEAASLSEYQIIYETQKKESKIRLLELENMVGDLTIQKQQLKIKRNNYLLLVFGLILIVILVITYFWKNQQKLKSLLEREKAIKETEEAERIRMAKDIHDDLGSGLTKINFLSELIYKKTQHLPEVSNNTSAVMETSKSLIGNMRDLIWALNIDNATIANLVARMREYTTDYLEDYQIDLKYRIQEELPQTPIKNECHRELFMVVKEILNNVSKHSHATEVCFSASLSEDIFKISIKDNGIGFNINTVDKGNGLHNIKHRIESIGGVFNITSDSSGTEICFLMANEKLLKN